MLIARRPGYLLAATDVDALDFADLVKRSEFRPPDEALTSLDRALRLWNGLPYGEFADRTWAIAEANRLGELRLVAVERCAQALLDLGRPQLVVSELEAETLDHPLRERLWCLLALSLYRTGRQADALAALRRAKERRADQLGLDPGPQLMALEEDILRQAESLDPVRMAAVLSSAAQTGPRPAVLGREREFTALQSLLDKGGVAVAAMTGEPGIGKTFLLEEFREHLCRPRLPHARGACHDVQGAPPLWPWLQLLNTLAQHSPPPDRPALANLLDDEKPSGSIGTALLRRNQAIAEWLIVAARSQPLVVVLDDLHWADPASLELLRDVIILTGRPAGNAPFKIVTAFRVTTQASALDNARGLSMDELLAHLVTLRAV
ncbi:BTAD domain-containing putative transcriptional regulator [Nonomuraea bangladeshensis]|uniref:BTAD domain-containing putative transcriptional regulator n=1 Tax=Nonomuraea bangladeshensis TaxID=404385 RepID=UPI003C2E2C7D